MIQYEDIAPEDMQRYWGEGNIFLKNPGGWNAYSLNRVDGEQVRLVLVDAVGVYGKPDKAVAMTYPAFFANAMLHRPPLGVLVRPDGSVFKLGWQHANGNELAKAIRRNDVFVEPIQVEEQAAQDEEPPKWAPLFVDCLRRARAALDHAPDGLDPADISGWPPYSVPIMAYVQDGAVQGDRRRNAPHGIHPKAISLVLEFLNQSQSTIGRAIRELKDKPVFLSGTAWLLPKTAYSVALMNGTYEVGRIALSSGDFIPPISRVRHLVGQMIYRTLA